MFAAFTDFVRQIRRGEPEQRCDRIVSLNLRMTPYAAASASQSAITVWVGP